MPTDIQQTFLTGRQAFHVVRYNFYKTRNILFEIAWRLAILVLPWQTRWFESAELGGWNWEQGSASVYASWILMLLVVVLGFWQKSKQLSPILKLKISGAMLLFVVISILGTDFDVRALLVVTQWWLQVALFLFFALTIYQAGISLRKLAFWFVMSLIPHVLLGFWQYSEQMVVGSKWLGIAAQRSENPGVSVIEHGLFRVLRMYGGFPHPNIFGGWSAIGLLVSLWLSATSDSKWRALGYIVVSGIFSVVVLLSYARSAWIAAVVGILILFVSRLRSQIRSRRKPGTTARNPNPPSPPYQGEVSEGLQFFLIALISSILVSVAVAVTQADHLAMRFNPSERLEAKSLETRVSSLRLGLETFRKNPWLGTGPNAELVKLVSANEKLPAPLESPHDVFILVVINFGLLGTALFAVLLYRGRKLFLRRMRANEIVMPVIAGVAILATFDHYLWSYWSGQALAGVCFLLIYLDEIKKDT